MCVVFLVIAGALLWTEHLAHALGYLTFLLILACPLMHIFMHGGKGDMEVMDTTSAPIAIANQSDGDKS